MNQTLKLPVGIENFEDIRKLGFYYIDKTKLGKSKSVYTTTSFWKDTQYEYVTYFF